jgi:hypothetical protein
VPPRFSREAQPAAIRPTSAVNAISFFILFTPFGLIQLALDQGYLNQAFTQSGRRKHLLRGLIICWNINRFNDLRMKSLPDLQPS